MNYYNFILKRKRKKKWERKDHQAAAKLTTNKRPKTFTAQTLKQTRSEQLRTLTLEIKSTAEEPCQSKF